MPRPPSSSANAGRRRCRSPNCVTASCRPLRSRPRTKSSSTGRCSTNGLPNGGAMGCASASPTAASISCIAVTSNCWPRRARPVIASWWASTATPRRRGLKGKGRPINPAEGRAEVLAALEAVDLVVVFEEDTPLELIKRVRPAVLVKGADYARGGGRPRSGRSRGRRCHSCRSGAGTLDHGLGAAFCGVRRACDPVEQAGQILIVRHEQLAMFSGIDRAGWLRVVDWLRSASR